MAGTCRYGFRLSNVRLMARLAMTLNQNNGHEAGTAFWQAKCDDYSVVLQSMVAFGGHARHALGYQPKAVLSA
jgi:hypothetical protein